MQDVRITCVSAEARESLLVALKGLVDGIEGNDGTLTYMALRTWVTALERGYLGGGRRGRLWSGLLGGVL